MADTIEWRRFVGPAGAVELARRGPVVFERRGDAAEVEARGLGSEVAAQKVLEGRARALLRDGYREEGVSMRPAPATSPPSAQDLARERAAAEAREAFERGLPRFVAAWRALGYDPLLSFTKQCTRVRTHPREVASACLKVAAEVFGAGFELRTRDFDPEHGKVQRIPERLLAEYYVSPVQVLVITACRLREPQRRTDDVDAPGLAYEIEARLRGLLSGSDAGSSPAP